MGDHYFVLATNNQFGILPAVKKCYAIAAINLKQIIDVTVDAQRKN